jgi:hypothetical protein
VTAVNVWARHYQHVWAERAADPAYPLWCRVAWLAFARHKSNGHAAFQRGQIAEIFGGFGADGFTPLDPSNLQRAIRDAKKAGLLDPSSGTECLVVPAHAIEGGQGNPTDECPVHARKAGARKRRAADGHRSNTDPSSPLDGSLVDLDGRSDSDLSPTL